MLGLIQGLLGGLVTPNSSFLKETNMKNLILAAVAAGWFFSGAGGGAKANDNGAAVDASAYSIITNVFSITSGAECASVGTAADCTVAAFTPDRTCNSCTILETTIN